MSALDLQVAVDAAGKASGARRDAGRALVLLARHFRNDHGWGRRRVARHFGWTETFVKTNVEVSDGGEDRP